MTTIEELSPAVLNAVKAYAFIQYNVSTVAELKTKIVDAEFEKIVNTYLDEAKLRIKRQKMDVYNAYVPTDEEIVAQIQAKIDAATPELQ